MLTDASRQKNMPTPVAADKLPLAGRAYYRPVGPSAPGGRKAVKIGKERFAPGSFPEIDDPTDAARKKEESDREAKNEAGGVMPSIPARQTEIDSDSDSKSDKDKKSSSSRKSEKNKSSRFWFGGNK